MDKTISQQVADTLRPKLMRYTDRIDVLCTYCKKYYSLSPLVNRVAYFCDECHEERHGKIR